MLKTSRDYNGSIERNHRAADAFNETPGQTNDRSDRSRECDANVSIQLNRWILKPLGTWPNVSREATTANKCIHRLANTVCFVLILFLLIPCGLYCVLELKDVYTKIRLAGPMSFCVMAAMKYSSLIFRENEILRCVRRIEGDWKRKSYPGDRRIMIESANFGRRVVVICGFFMYGGAVFFYLALPFSVGKIFDAEINGTFRPLVYPVARMIVDTRYSPVNDVFFYVQCLCGFVAHSITTGACSLAVTFAMHACGQLKLLMAWLEHLVDGRKGVLDNVDERLSMIVEQHVRVLSFISLTEKLLHEISLVEIAGCTLNLCLLGYYVIMEWDFSEPIISLTYAILLVSLTFNIFIFCYIGELLEEQCVKVGEKSYMIDWYRLPGKKSAGLVLMIAMSNSSSQLTAGNLIDLSLRSFGDVIKTSMAYLNMLRKMTS